jgi:threonyl-tRNA synthetase
MYLNYFKIFDIQKYQMRFSKHSSEGLGKKYVDQADLWLKTEDMVRRALIKGNVPFVEVEDEAAFYGPKIDVQVWSAIGREFTLATNQVDFAIPGRFGLSFKNSGNQQETPLCIHRAPLGTHERFIGFLIEHFAGAFPFWMSPEQIRFMTISEEGQDVALSLEARCKKQGYRVSSDLRNEKLGYKIREAQLKKIPYMVVLGKQELAEGKVALRHRTRGDLGKLGVEEFFDLIKQEADPLRP